MKGKTILVASLLATIAVMASPVTLAGKPGGGGSGGDSPFRVEDLGQPAGSVSSSAAAVNNAGNIAVGSAYWAATFDYPNNHYAARWTRNASTGAWQAEDLRPLLPPHSWSGGLGVNDAGTVVGRIIEGNNQRFFVITSAGAVIELGTGEAVAGLRDTDEMVGSRSSGDPAVPATPLYWSSASATPVELPVLQPGEGGAAQWFHGAALLGILSDDTGSRLVRWIRSGAGWSVEAIREIPAKYLVKGVAADGRLALMHCAGQLYLMQKPYACDYRAAVWDAPYDGAPSYLPNLAGTYSWTNGVTEDGKVVGVTVTSNGVDMVPVVWPTPATVVRLPLLSGGKTGTVLQPNAYGQMPGDSTFQFKGQSGQHAVVWTPR